jgi:hypothetical protein
MLLTMFVGVPLLAGLALWGQYKRYQANEAWAASVGWLYLGTDQSLANRWRGTPFGTGHDRKVSQLMSGPFQGRAASSFVYRYSTGSGKDESTYTFHVLSMALPAYLPTLQLTPEGLGARIAKTFGAKDIEFESEDFNRAWRVEAGVERFAHDVLHPRTMERLMQADARGLNLRIEATDVLCWTTGDTKTALIGPRLQVLKAVVDAIPRYVWLDHGYDPGYGPGGQGRPPTPPPVPGLAPDSSPYRPPGLGTGPG